MNRPKASRERNLEAIIIMGAGFLVFYHFFQLKALFLIALGLLLAGAFSSFLTEKIAWGWFKLAEVLGWINSKIILILVFYLFLTPIALLKKLLSPKGVKNPSSNYVSVEKTYAPKDMENTW